MNSMNYWHSLALTIVFFFAAIWAFKKQNPKFRSAFFFVVLGITMFSHAKKCFRHVDFFVVFQQSLSKIFLWEFSEAQILPIVLIPLTIITLTFVFGNLFCTWLCPFGIMHRVIYLSRWMPRLPQGLSRSLSNLRWIGLASFFGILFYFRQDPFLWIFDRLTIGKVKGVIIYEIALLILALFIYKPFCRFFCPIGLFLGHIARISGRNRLELTADCVKCGLATKKCEVSALSCPEVNGEKKLEFDQSLCCMCQDCLHACPKSAIKL